MYGKFDCLVSVRSELYRRDFESIVLGLFEYRGIIYRGGMNKRRFCIVLFSNLKRLREVMMSAVFVNITSKQAITVET